MKTRLRFTIRFPTTRSAIRPDPTRKWLHGRIWASCCCVSVFRIRHRHRQTRQSRRRGRPPSLASSLMVGAMLLSLVGDNRTLHERADELVAVAVEQGVPWWHTIGTVYRGWVKVNQGDVSEGTSLMDGGLTAYRATGAEMWLPHTALLARAYDIAGQIEEGLSLLDDALQLVEKTGECWFAAELNRHKGHLLIHQGHTEPP